LSESLYLLFVTPLVHFIAPGREISRHFELFAAAALLAPDSKLAFGLSQIRKPAFVAGQTMFETEVLDWLATSLAAVRGTYDVAIQLQLVTKCDTLVTVIRLVDIVTGGWFNRWKYDWICL
jgi:hypothetical protein